MSAPEGVLVVDKPRGKTSHDIVAQARRYFGTRAVGHAGTLDPMASGVLLLLLGEATKLSPYLTADDKRYEAQVRFGKGTDTLDAEGQVTEEYELPPGWLDRERLAHAIDQERERLSQVPPAFSAIKVDGERAHRLSRRGLAPELAPRPVVVRELELLEADDTAARFVMTVSKGYFVRSFARDLCSTLGVPGHLVELRRVQSGAFTLAEAIAWPPSTRPELLPLGDAARRCLPVRTLRPEAVARARQGRALTLADFEQTATEPGVNAWLDPDGALVAVGEESEPGRFRVVRGFVPSA